MLRKFAVLASESIAGRRGAPKLAGRGPGCPGGLKEREQRAPSSVEASPVYRKVSAGVQLSSSTVGVGEDAVGDSDPRGKFRRVEVLPLAASKAPEVLLAADSVLLTLPEDGVI